VQIDVGLDDAGEARFFNLDAIVAGWEEWDEVCAGIATRPFIVSIRAIVDCGDLSLRDHGPGRVAHLAGNGGICGLCH